MSKYLCLLIIVSLYPALSVKAGCNGARIECDSSGYYVGGYSAGGGINGFTITINQGDSVTLCVSNIGSCSGTISINGWYRNDTLIQLENNACYVPKIEGVYKAIWRNDYTGILRMKLIVNKTSSINIPSENLNAFIISPNPNTGVFLLSNVNKESTIYVYDLLGNIVLQKVNVQPTDLNIDISNNARGVYYVKVVSIEGEILGIKKVVVQ